MFSLRRLPRSFSLRTALVLVALVCLVLAVGVRRAKRVLAQKRAVQAILASGGDFTTDPSEAGAGPFDAPDWKLAFGLAGIPSVTKVSLHDSTDLGYPHPQSALPHLAAFPNLPTLEIFGDWFDDRCCKHLESLEGPLDLIVEANDGLTTQGFAELLRPRLKGIIVSGADLSGLANGKLAWPASLQFVGLHNCRGMDSGACVELSRRLGEECQLQTLSATYRGGRVVAAPVVHTHANHVDQRSSSGLVARL